MRARGLGFKGRSDAHFLDVGRSGVRHTYYDSPFAMEFDPLFVIRKLLRANFTAARTFVAKSYNDSCLLQLPGA